MDRINRKPRGRRVTLADIAARAEVSVATVSLILSGRPEWLRRFQADTVRRVRASAKRLGYRANLLASGLPTGSSPLFALVIRDFVRHNPQDWHLWAFEGELLAGVMRGGARAHLYPVVVSVDPDGDKEAMRPAEEVIDGGVFGAIVRAPNAVLEKYLRSRIRRGQRIAVLFPNRVTQWPTNAIALDDIEAGRTAGELLAAQGRRQWAVVQYGPPAIRETHRRRRQGFEQVAKRVGAAVRVVRLPRLIDEVTPRELMRLRRLGADAFFSVDSALAICTLQACLKVGMHPGTDFNLVGMNCPRWHAPPLPRITSMSISWREVGSAAVQQLTELPGGGSARFDTILMNPQVIPGDTCPAPTPAQR